MFNSKFIGGLLLIIGTSIGGGMLALPVSTAQMGFTHSIFFLVLCWLIMTLGALLILEVKLHLPKGSNMISMARSTLGTPGLIIAWITYLLLLYNLLAAYISGGSDVLNALIDMTSFSLPNGLSALLFTVVFGWIIYRGIKTVDYVNRGLMFGKLSIYLLLILIIGPHIKTHYLGEGSYQGITTSLMILITSFGFASIVPSLCDYFNNDARTLRSLILLGSFIPLICYMLWDAVIMGTIEPHGPDGLHALMISDHPNSGLIEALRNTIHNPWIDGFFSIFTSICMITAFLGVSLGLFDFLADGFSLKKTGSQKMGIFGLTFIPPLILVLIYPGIYLHALRYAGACCVILLLLLPTLMAWQVRKINPQKNLQLVPGGYLCLSLLIIAAILLLLIGIY